MRGGCIYVFCVHFLQIWSDSVQNWRSSGLGMSGEIPRSPTPPLQPRCPKSRLRRGKDEKWKSVSESRIGFSRPKPTCWTLPTLRAVPGVSRRYPRYVSTSEYTVANPRLSFALCTAGVAKYRHLWTDLASNVVPKG